MFYYMVLDSYESYDKRGFVTILPGSEITIDILGPLGQITVGTSSQIILGPMSQITVGPSGQIILGPTGQITVGPLSHNVFGPIGQITVRHSGQIILIYWKSRAETRVDLSQNNKLDRETYAYG